MFHKNVFFFLSCRALVALVPSEETVTSRWATDRTFPDPIGTGHTAEAGRRTTTLAATIDDGDRSGATRCLSLYPEAQFWWRSFGAVGLGHFVSNILLVHDFKLKLKEKSDRYMTNESTDITLTTDVSSHFSTVLMIRESLRDVPWAGRE